MMVETMTSDASKGVTSVMRKRHRTMFGLAILCASLGLAARAQALVLGQGESSDRSTLFSVQTLAELPQTTPPGKEAPSSAETSSPQTAGAAYRALLNRITSLEVQAQALASGEAPLPYELIDIDARMPEHRHGMNLRPSITAIAPQRWRVDGFKLHMPGLWVVALKVKRGEQEEVVSFQLNI